MKEEIVEASPSRLTDGLRDMGYTFNTSGADIADNSIAAEASKLHIRATLDYADEVSIMFADNGYGMIEADLRNAMLYGSKKRASPKSLGKFGLGLKTASTAICRRLTVVSRVDGIYSIRQWDLDLIAERNEWVLLTPELEDYEEAIELLNQVSDENGDGTVVIWEKVDRLFTTAPRNSIKTHLRNSMLELGEHLSGVFYNFLERENEYPDVNITIEFEDELHDIQPWDPFCRWLEGVEPHPNDPIPVKKGEGLWEERIGEFELHAYILPNKNQMSKDTQDKIRYGHDNQGFHIFREGRMIYSGGWPNRLFVKEPHLNLLRVELSFDHRLDDYFQIDVRKSRFTIPAEIRSKIKEVLAAVRNEANSRYRKGSTSKESQSNLDKAHEESGKAIDKQYEDSINSEVTEADESTQTATIVNGRGHEEVTIKIPINHEEDRLVNHVDSLDNGVLWCPALIEGNRHAVLLNKTHEFYKKCYLPIQGNKNAVKAMDMVFWALAEGELSTVNNKDKRIQEDYRIQASRILRNMSDELPEPPETSENAE
ncbi:ATP-binding protein [Sediminitomix flava]|uniref:Histidine kinase/DNA gyrase B/HSP90-like ATPase n=1 Tax=Sediminitomix flava TaxID=379075 RepID=A0A315ZAP6_SEDFL|nr:ATP-binding protein [Sediminitomix flava]PWJ42666.1 histidine kinase/DNA gyrase B/HSP90-like ATPase [Sediminitomix flava]